jgi:HSP20 family molecular chaperone IbpA
LFLVAPDLGQEVKQGRRDGPETGIAGIHQSSLGWRGRMSRLSLFNSPLLLGFDHFERTLDRISKTGSEGYPPYNIEQVSDEALSITLAVAGFAIEDLEIQLEDNQLVVRGRQKDDSERVYLHRGIAARQFQKSFVLAEGIEVTGASLDNGLLSIDLQRPKVEPQVRSVPIKKAAQRMSERQPGDRQNGATEIAVTANAKS